MKYIALAAVATVAMTGVASADTLWKRVPIYEYVKVCTAPDAGNVLGGMILGGIIGNNIGDGRGNGAAGAIIGGALAAGNSQKCHWEKRVHGYRYEQVN